MERSVPSGEFLVARSDERGAESGEFGIPGSEVGEEMLDGGRVGKLQRFLGVADDFLETAEEKDFETDGLGNRWHGRIVTRAKGGG